VPSSDKICYISGHFLHFVTKQLFYFYYFRKEEFAHEHVGTCLKIAKISQTEQITDVVGTFVNGVLHGVVKITLSKGTVIIATFRNGIHFGLRREWTSNGKLQFVGYFNSVPIGKSWRKISDYLIYGDEGRIKINSEEEELDVAISKNNEVYLATYQNHMYALENVFEATFEGN
jgi:hypothetical protein